MRKLYYFYDKEYNELTVHYRHKYYYVYQKYSDFISGDPWRFTLYGYYKITSYKQLKKEIKRINKNLIEVYGCLTGYKEIKNKKQLQKIIEGLNNEKK